MSLRERWAIAARLVADNRDLLDGRPMPSHRPEDSEPVAALVARGWAPFLLACDDAQLDSVEALGLEAKWPDDTPASLRTLVETARSICALPAFASPSFPSSSSTSWPGAPRRRETPRKRAQIDAFARVILPLANHASRIIDVGSGHGHLTREIAERIARPVIGLERDVRMTDRARRLSRLSPSRSPSPAFAQTDVLRDGLAFAEGDCAIGLHACGELGDAMVESAATCGASLALVGCCLQKRSALSRPPLCDEGRTDGALDLPRDLLGLSNLTARNDGVEASRAENLAGRERRLALHRLLCADGTVVRPGAEIAGLNRRAAQGDLSSLVARAFALRGRPAPPREAVEEAARWARTYHARARRLSLPRAMLARVLEVFVLLDRARHLEERGYHVAIGALFPPEVSARNLVLVGRRMRQ